MALGSGHATTTSMANYIPEIWSKETIRYREANLVFGKLVKRASGDILNYGDTLHIPLSSTAAASDKTANTEITVSETTEDKVDINITNFKYRARLIEDIVRKQSIVNAEDEVRKEIGYSVAKAIDTTLGTLIYSGVTQAVGSEAGDPGDEDVIRAIQYLDDADAPDMDRFAVVKPRVWASLLKVSKFVESQAITFSKSESPILTWKMPDVYGVKWAKSTNVYVTGNIAYNAIFQKDAIMLVLQKDITIEKSREARFIGDLYIAHAIYGSNVTRATHAVQLKSAA